MTDETDTTSEVARVLIDHTRLTNDGKCHCGHQGRLGESFTAHQANALREAGLLRGTGNTRPGPTALKARISELEAERDMLKRGGAELGRQIDHYLTWVLDATDMHHLIDEDGDGDWELVWERLAGMRAELGAKIKLTQEQARVIERLEAEVHRLKADRLTGTARRAQIAEEQVERVRALASGWKANGYMLKESMADEVLALLDGAQDAQNSPQGSATDGEVGPIT